MLELAEPVVRRKKPKVKNQLPDQLERDLVQIFKLLSDETRLRVLMYLYREGELHVSALCERLQQSQPAVSHHLALLRVAGLIGCRRDGKHNFYSIRQTYFHRVVAELFQTIADPAKLEFRFEDFIVTPRQRSEA
jgi:ArsR family transcriptional regulator, arsenate/arsenite/antimonite-responsive transcriptional repressor